MILHPPHPPLFPYTTLFRSSCAILNRAFSTPIGNAGEISSPATLTGIAASLPIRRASARSAASSPRDRKSTRLNSSHLGISYAVFCLKKKTEQESEER